MYIPHKREWKITQGRKCCDREVLDVKASVNPEYKLPVDVIIVMHNTKNSELKNMSMLVLLNKTKSTIRYIVRKVFVFKKL